jgi:hypothetical protein
MFRTTIIYLWDFVCSGKWKEDDSSELRTLKNVKRLSALYRTGTVLRSSSVGSKRIRIL